MTPLDANVFKNAIFDWINYPTILGNTVGGFVDAIGEGVTKVKVGDRVVSHVRVLAAKGNPRYGGYQRFTIAEELEVIEVGDVSVLCLKY